MSTETPTNDSASKKSFFTRVAEDVAAKKAAKESGETIVPTPEEVAAKRLLKRAGLALVGTAAAVTAVIVLVNRMSNEETDTEEESEETTSED
jgi:negative regulator of sigma E activity